MRSWVNLQEEKKMVTGTPRFTLNECNIVCLPDNCKWNCGVTITSFSSSPTSVAGGVWVWWTCHRRWLVDTLYKIISDMQRQYCGLGINLMMHWRERECRIRSSDLLFNPLNAIMTIASHFIIWIKELFVSLFNQWKKSSPWFTFPVTSCKFTVLHMDWRQVVMMTEDTWTEACPWALVKGKGRISYSEWL